MSTTHTENRHPMAAYTLPACRTFVLTLLARYDAPTVHVFDWLRAWRVTRWSEEELTDQIRRRYAEPECLTWRTEMHDCAPGGNWEAEEERELRATDRSLKRCAKIVFGVCAVIVVFAVLEGMR